MIIPLWKLIIDLAVTGNGMSITSPGWVRFFEVRGMGPRQYCSSGLDETGIGIYLEFYLHQILQAHIYLKSIIFINGFAEDYK